MIRSIIHISNCHCMHLMPHAMPFIRTNWFLLIHGFAHKIQMLHMFSALISTAFAIHLQQIWHKKIKTSNSTFASKIYGRIWHMNVTLQNKLHSFTNSNPTNLYSGFCRLKPIWQCQASVNNQTTIFCECISVVFSVTFCLHRIL